jgi:hypothetical protein
MIEYSQEEIKDRYIYDNLRGGLRYRKNDESTFHHYVTGDTVGCLNADKYEYAHCGKKNYKVDHLLWKMFYGEDIPFAKEMDHINGIRDDNRIENLRLVTIGGNQQNRCKFKNNTSGVAGVSRLNNKWRARITLDGKVRYLGVYDTLEEASQVREIAERVYGFTRSQEKGRY